MFLLHSRSASSEKVKSMCKRLWERCEGEMENSWRESEEGRCESGQCSQPTLYCGDLQTNHSLPWPSMVKEEEEAGEKKKHSVRQVL